MGNGAVKTIVLLMGLVVLSVLVGGLISDGIAASSGAFAVIAFIGIAFAMLVIGKQSWKLLYFLPALCYNVPIGSYFAGISLVPTAMGSAVAVLIYGVLLWAMGYIRFRWRALLVLDLCVVAIALLFVWNYIQHPVTMQIIDSEAENVGGKEYVWFICAILYYIALSSMSGSAEELIPVLKKSFYIFCVGQSLGVLYLVGRLANMGLMSVDQRYSVASDLSCAIVFLVFCSAPFLKLLTSPKKIFIASVAFVGVLLGGRRETFVSLGEALCFASLMKKEFTSILILGVFLYGFFFILGEQKVLADAPISIQRVMTTLPGISVSDSVRAETEGSSETRRVIWKLGLDPRTGYIKDYIWGDGFQANMNAIRRRTIAYMRGTVDTSETASASAFAASGTWHNGWLVTVHRLGLVGLAAVNIVFVVGMVLLLKVSNAYRSMKEYPYLMALCLPFPQIALSYPWGTQTLITFFFSFEALGIIKILYCAAREQGKMYPLFFREQYMPMMIRNAESARQPTMIVSN